MSKGKFSDTIVNQILARLQSQLASQEHTIKAILAKDTSYRRGADRITPGSGAAVRLVTDIKQEGILTAGSLNLLSKQFSEASIAAKDANAKQLIRLNKETYLKNSAAEKSPELAKHITDLIGLGKPVNEILSELAIFASKILGRNSLYNEFVDYYTKTFPDDDTVIITEDKEFIAKNLVHGEFNIRFADFIASVNGKVISQFIYINTDAGHFLGIFNQRLIRAFGLTANVLDVHGDPSIPKNPEIKFFSNSDITEDEAYINELFQSMLHILSDADHITSNLINNVKLNAISQKTVYDSSTGATGESSIEIQLSIANQLAGSQLSTLGKNLTALINHVSNPGPQRDIDKQQQTEVFRNKLISFFSGITTLANYIDRVGTELTSGNYLDDLGKKVAANLQANSKQIAAKLIETEGSDSVLKALKVTFSSILSGKPLPAKEVTNSKDSINLFKSKISPKQSVPTVKKPTKSSTKISRPPSVTISKKLRTLGGQFTSLVSLQNLLNQNLHTQIQKNMGTGLRRDVLNYQTGRFAESAKVEKMSQSREGMITAFYSYMRNPYATFSTGGAQESPATRDPKLLISRSIREIGATMVGNRMRAVLV